MQVGQYPPQPERDPHWDVGVPSELPYTVASLPFRGAQAEPGAAELVVPLDKQRQALVAGSTDDKRYGSSLMLNSLVNNVVNWASNPLASVRGGSKVEGQNARSCSTVSAPNPRHLRQVPSAIHLSNGTHLYRNASLRNSFKVIYEHIFSQQVFLCLLKDLSISLDLFESDPSSDAIAPLS